MIFLCQIVPFQPLLVIMSYTHFYLKKKEKNLHYRWQLNTMHNYASIMFRVININWQLNSRRGEKKDEQKEIDQAVSY